MPTKQTETGVVAKRGQKRHHKPRPHTNRQKLSTSTPRPAAASGLSRFFQAVRRLMSPKPLLIAAGGIALSLLTRRLARRH